MLAFIEDPMWYNGVLNGGVFTKQLDCVMPDSVALGCERDTSMNIKDGERKGCLCCDSLVRERASSLLTVVASDFFPWDKWNHDN